MQLSWSHCMLFAVKHLDPLVQIHAKAATCCCELSLPRVQMLETQKLLRCRQLVLPARCATLTHDAAAQHD